jgi:CubicO group peptidase (beta-lactamase class C family)
MNGIENGIENDVQAVLDELVGSGAERGVQVAVYRHGEQIVDAVAGVADPATGRPVTPDTPFFATSTGKGVAATVVHVLAEHGVLDDDTPIARLWPEFAAHGKQDATVAHALTHSVGVPGLPAGLAPEAFLDWDGMCALIADAHPWWEPGTATGYHAQTFGWIVGEIVRRATGEPISQVLREAVAGPLGVADELFFGVPEADVPRLARLEDPAPPAGGEDGVDSAAEGFEMPAPAGAQEGWTWAPPATMPFADYGNRADLLATDIPAGATMTARAVRPHVRRAHGRGGRRPADRGRPPAGRNGGRGDRHRRRAALPGAARARLRHRLGGPVRRADGVRDGRQRRHRRLRRHRPRPVDRRDEEPQLLRRLHHVRRGVLRRAEAPRSTDAGLPRPGDGDAGDVTTVRPEPESGEPEPAGDSAAEPAMPTDTGTDRRTDAEREAAEYGGE